MQHYLLIESRDNFGRSGGGFCVELALALAGQGESATVLLVQNGVLPARDGAQAQGLAELASAGVPVLADDFSLAERGIAASQLAKGVRASALDIVVDRMIDGWKVLWH
jgi:sulfur transfer complex TusBCD TusB component (DsrH family)